MFTIEVTPEDIKNIEEKTSGFNDEDRHSLDEAVKCLVSLPCSEEQIRGAQKNVLFLVGMGKEFLQAHPMKSEILEDIDTIQKSAKALCQSLNSAHAKTLYLIGQRKGFAGLGDLYAADAAKNLASILEGLTQSAKEAYAEHKSNASKTEWINSNLSAQDEMVGFCRGVFNLYRPGIASKDTCNPFHYFCLEVFSLIEGKSREKSLIGSVRKILK